MYGVLARNRFRRRSIQRRGVRPSQQIVCFELVRHDDCPRCTTMSTLPSFNFSLRCPEYRCGEARTLKHLRCNIEEFFERYYNQKRLRLASAIRADETSLLNFSNPGSHGVGLRFLYRSSRRRSPQSARTMQHRQVPFACKAYLPNSKLGEIAFRTGVWKEPRSSLYQARPLLSKSDDWGGLGNRERAVPSAEFRIPSPKNAASGRLNADAIGFSQIQLIYPHKPPAPGENRVLQDSHTAFLSYSREDTECVFPTRIEDHR